MMCVAWVNAQSRNYSICSGIVVVNFHQIAMYGLVVSSCLRLVDIDNFIELFTAHRSFEIQRDTQFRGWFFFIDRHTMGLITG